MTSKQPDALQRNLIRLVRQLSIPRFHQQVLSRTGVEIDRVQAIALSRIVDGGPLRLTDLAEQLGVACSTAGRHAAHLEARGLARRAVDPTDARAVTVAPTRDGVALVGQLRRAYRQVLGEAMGDWRRDEVESLTILLGRLADRLNRLSTGVTV